MGNLFGKCKMNDITLQSKFKNYVVRAITKEGVAIN